RSRYCRRLLRRSRRARPVILRSSKRSIAIPSRLKVSAIGFVLAAMRPPCPTAQRTAWPPDIDRLLYHMRAPPFELLAQLVLDRRHHRDRRRWSGPCDGCGRRRWRRRLVGGFKPRRHDRLLDLGGIANRAGDQRALSLLVISRRVGEPAFERVALIAI